jgi:hypothetical protein
LNLENRITDYQKEGNPMTGTPTPQTADKKPLRLTKRIGSTTYKVSVHFSRTSKETAGDKILRLIEREAANQ